MKWTVPRAQKLAPFLSEQLGSSKKQLRKALEASLCRVNGTVERFASTILKKGDLVELSADWNAKRSIPELTVIFEDEYLKICNKPQGFVCSDVTLVHRLDKDTTGLLMFAKQGRERFLELFKNREIQKTYLALVDGIPKYEKGRIETLLIKKGSFEGQTIWGSIPKSAQESDSKNQTAITEWEKIAVGQNTSLLMVKPFTGRTHQIRVHLSEMGHPILVDRQYAKFFRCKLFFRRPLLHAWKLRFIHPFSGLEMDLNAPLPADFQSALSSLSISYPEFC